MNTNQATGKSSGGRRGFRRRSHGGSLDFELNITSIIDCFTVLIAFCLISASFVSVGILDAEVASAGAMQPQVDAAPISVTIGLETDHSIRIDVRGKANHTQVIGPRGADRQWNNDALIDQLAIIKGEWPSLHSVTVLAENSVDYREVVKSMELARKAVPSVQLGGF